MENKKLNDVNWYESNAQSVLEKLEVSPDKGLTKEQIGERREKNGKNELRPPKKVGLLARIFHQLRDVPTIVLLIAVALSFALAIKEGSGLLEPFVILAVVVMNLILAITQEGKATKALEALAKLNTPECIVVRDWVRQNIDTTELVPGDIVILGTGNIVPADCRLLKSTGLFSDEAALTGESEPAEKDAALSLSGNVPVGDQHNMLFSGCVVTAGHAMAVVTATGMATQMGRIAEFLNETQKVKTPLQIRLDQLGKTISWIAIVSAVVLLALGLRSGAAFDDMILVAIALSVAAVPETLSLIVTLSLTHGVQKMVKKNALIRKLTAVETLGSTSVICSDKTGTLTQNRMTIKQLWMCGGEPFAAADAFSDEQRRFLEMFALAGNAAVETDESGNESYLGNATEIGILRLLNEKGFEVNDTAKAYQRVAEIPFSSERKMMTVILKDKDGGYLVLTKGALDRLLLSPESTADLEAARRVHDVFASKALRVIALASKHIDELPDNAQLERLERDTKLIGIVGLIDPPRPEAALSIAKAKKAGIRTIMITGDHAATAQAIAKDLGILQEGQKVMTGARLAQVSEAELQDTISDYSVYARVSPEDKIRIVKAWQANDAVVSMTGDGVNDAPALRAADIGVAMGKTGTEVSKNASDMILTDDNFSTIVEAIGEGRNVYSIIKKTIYFLLVCSLSEVVIMLFAQIAGWGIVLTPVMLLLINMLGDGIPGIQLAYEKSDPSLMNNKPLKRGESFFSGDTLRLILRQTVACAIVVLAGYFIGTQVALPGTPPSAAIGQTMAFLITGWTSIIHIFHVRTSKSVFKAALLDNKPLLASALFMILIFGLLVATPIAPVFGLTPIGGYHWLIVVGLCVIPTIVREIGRLYDEIPHVIEYRRLRREFIDKNLPRKTNGKKAA
ncbi:MAG: cation-translocating P-type ATPase [Myxococcales bacterium]|jgi:calcium-translocating P-type ATPase|nr:cation-translocating P-type ATPase [Myxococcales bacterium]